MTIEDYIAQRVSETPEFVPVVLAAQIEDELRQMHTSELAAWLDVRAGAIIHQHIRTIIHRSRHLLRNGGARVERDAKPKRAFAKAAASGAEALIEYRASVFDATYCIDAENTQRRLGDMTGDDHRFVATQYDASAAATAMLAAFHRQVAKVVGKKRTADVMSEEQLLKLRASIVGSDKLAT